MENKIFCGNGKSVGQYGCIGVSICLDDIPAEHITTSKNGKRYVNLNVNPNKNGSDKFGKTHNVSVNTWKPNQQQNVGNQQQNNDITFTPVDDNEVPF